MADRVGLLGGTFDPIHVGHLIVVRAARETLGLDRFVLIPSANPPHKLDNRVTPAEHRLEMVRLAVADEPGLEVSDCEIRRPGPSYTIDTIAEVRRNLGDQAEIVWLIGSDSLPELPSWHRAAELVDACRIVTAGRPGWERPDTQALAETLRQDQIDRLLADCIETPLIDISATDVRRRVSRGLSVRWLVPEAVRNHIHARKLYRPLNETR